MGIKSSNETALVNVLLQRLAMLGIWAWRNQTTGIYDPTRKQFRSFHGLKGVSDILGIVPINGALHRRASMFSEPAIEETVVGQFLAIEAKMPGKKPNKEQRLFLDMVREKGGIGILAYSLDDLESGLRDCGVIR